MEITLTKKTNTIYGFAWDLAIAISKMDDQKAVWANIFGDLDVYGVEGVLEGQAKIEGLTTTEVYHAFNPGNSSRILKSKKYRGVRFSTQKLIALGDRAGFNISTIISN